ncbi:MAG: hypothetical protein H7Y06_09315 [Opitutaceae bacterium]|nr:hypothetical protein [Opitutaceae bacterium]
MNPSQSVPENASLSPVQHYTPGYVGVKLIMIGLGLGLFIVGMAYLWTPLRLVMWGNRAMAEATTVTKTKKGAPDIVLKDDVQVKASFDPRDRSHVFWNEFRFQTADGRVVNVRATVGSQLKPLYSLINGDGLPTTDLVFYDVKQPEIVVFPLIISTWFAAGVLAGGGLLMMFIGSVLLYWARKPIELPHLPPSVIPLGK